jgi:hypothetical protein
MIPVTCGRVVTEEEALSLVLGGLFVFEEMTLEHARLDNHIYFPFHREASKADLRH